VPGPPAGSLPVMMVGVWSLFKIKRASVPTRVSKQRAAPGGGLASADSLEILLIGSLPAHGIDLLHKEPKGIKRIARGRGDLHRLSRSSISAIEQLADRRNPGCLALCLQRQARELGDG
jgi:hypothetical protein